MNGLEQYKAYEEMEKTNPEAAQSYLTGLLDQHREKQNTRKSWFLGRWNMWGFNPFYYGVFDCPVEPFFMERIMHLIFQFCALYFTSVLGFVSLWLIPVGVLIHFFLYNFMRSEERFTGGFAFFDGKESEKRYWERQ